MASRVEWQWQDAGSGPGHMQRVVVYDETPTVDPALAAYRRLIDHGLRCRTCRTTDADGWANSTCDEARWLYRAWRVARGGPSAPADSSAPEGSPAA
jgi:hypothetical protein